MRVAVVGHIEWATFAVIDHLPQAGEIIKATDSWQEPAGGGSVAALQLAQMADECLFFTKVGDDYFGRQALEQLRRQGVTVHASIDPSLPTRQAFVDLDLGQHERTITLFGPPVKPSGTDQALPWPELADMDAVYFASGDLAALRAARQAPVVVSTARVLPILQTGAVPLNALVHSLKDPSEHYRSGDLQPVPELIVTTNGAAGGSTDAGFSYAAEAVPPTAFKDTYGCGDSFAAGLTFALGSGLGTEEALKLAARCGAEATQRYGAFHSAQ